MFLTSFVYGVVVRCAGFLEDRGIPLFDFADDMKGALQAVAVGVD